MNVFKVITYNKGFEDRYFQNHFNLNKLKIFNIGLKGGSNNDDKPEDNPLNSDKGGSNSDDKPEDEPSNSDKGKSIHDIFKSILTRQSSESMRTENCPVLDTAWSHTFENGTDDDCWVIGDNNGDNKTWFLR